MPILSKFRDIFKGSSSVKRKKVYHNVILQNPDEVWSIKGEIGDGAYGKVYKAEHIVNGTLAALKKVALEEEEDLDNFMVEIDILAECQHTNIVRLLEAYHWEGCLWMYLEFCDGGAVDSIMVDLDRPLTEPQIAYITHHLLQALDYIHHHKVIHRDIKAGNVLLTTEGGVKLADFGVSAKNKHTMDKRGTFIGTPYWLAPEVIKCETFIDSKYDYKADIWSLGITLIEFAQIEPPNHDVSPLRVLLKIQKADPPKLDHPSKFSKDFNDFIARCLVKEPEDRPDARALMRHPFVCGEQKPKHIMALLIEYQADVVEEDVEEDHRSSRLSIDSEDHSTASQDTTATSDTSLARGHKEVTPTGVMERRVSKGPAPPPPVHQKKGPAPSVPPVAAPSPVVAPPSSSPPPAASVTTSSPSTTPSTTTPLSTTGTDVKPGVATSTTIPTPTSTTTASSTPPPAPASKKVSPAVTKASSPPPSGKATPVEAAPAVIPHSSALPSTTPAVPSTTPASSTPPTPSSLPVTSTPIKDAGSNSSSEQAAATDHSTTNDSQSQEALATRSADVSIITDPGLQQVSATSATPHTDASVAASTAAVATPVSARPSGAVSAHVSDCATVVSSVINVGVTTAVTDVAPSFVSPSPPPPTTTTIPLTAVPSPPLVPTTDQPAVSPMVSVTTLGDDSALDLTLAANSADNISSAALVLVEKLEVREEGDDESMPCQQAVVKDATTKTHIVSDDSLLGRREDQLNLPIAASAGDAQVAEVVSSPASSTTVVSIADGSITGLVAGDVSANSAVIATISSNSPDLSFGSEQQQPPHSYGSPIPIESHSPSPPLPSHPNEGFLPDAATPVSRRSAESRQRIPPDSPPPPSDIPVSPDHHSIIAGEATPPPVATPTKVTDPARPFQVPEGGLSDIPAQIIASIGSEGTVIVRTPTPTPATPTPPSDNPTSPAAVPPPLLSQPSVVTFSGPGVVESAPSTPQDSPRDGPPPSTQPDEADSRSALATLADSIALAEVEAVQLLDDVIDHHTGGHDSLLSTDSLPPASPAPPAGGQVLVVGATEPEVVVVKPPHTDEAEGEEVVISSSSILEDESNTDDASPERLASPTPRPAPGGSEAAHISVVSVAEEGEADGDTRVTIEGTTTGDTDVDSFIPLPTKEESGRSPPSRLPNGREAAVPGTPAHRHEDRSDSDSISTISSEKENSKPRRRGGSISGDDDSSILTGSGSVVLRRTAGRTISGDSTMSHLTTASTSMISTAGDGVGPPLQEDVSLRPIDKNRQNRQANNLMRNGRTKEENDSLALRKKTRKRTRKFMIDGVVVTTTTSKVIYGDDEEGNIMASGHLARKQELRELKILQKLEQKQFQELGIKASQARHEQERKFESEKTQLIRSYDNDVDLLNRSQKQEVERTEAQHELELKGASKKIRADQEKELRSFRDSLKTELKLLKQEVDLLPKDVRKETLRSRKEHLESDQAHREKVFLERLHQNHESSMKRLSEEHRSHVALLERQFLQKKHQLLRAREAALWELEERHLHDRHQLAKRQLKDIFFLQRHQMLLRHEKELEQVRRQNTHREEELVKRQAVERRAMPKRIKQEMKARELMFRESMRISTTNLPDFHHDEKERLRKFQECEKRRYEAEKKRAEQKHKRQLEELQAATEAHAKELEQMQNEKRKMLMEHETHKLKGQEEEYQKELREWKNNLKPRKQKLEEEFEQQLMEQEQFYGAYLNNTSTTLMAAAGPDTAK